MSVGGITIMISCDYLEITGPSERILEGTAWASSEFGDFSIECGAFTVNPVTAGLT